MNEDFVDVVDEESLWLERKAVMVNSLRDENVCFGIDLISCCDSLGSIYIGHEANYDANGL